MSVRSRARRSALREIRCRAEGPRGLATGRRPASRGGLRRLALLSLVCCGLAQSGCGTLITQIDGPLFAPTTARAFNWDEKAVTPVYAGTRLAFGGALRSEIKPMWIADVPFSFTADTLILPITLIQEGVWRLFGPEEEEVLRPKATEPS